MDCELDPGQFSRLASIVTFVTCKAEPENRSIDDETILLLAVQFAGRDIPMLPCFQSTSGEHRSADGAFQTHGKLCPGPVSLANTDSSFAGEKILVHGHDKRWWPTSGGRQDR